MFKVQGSRFKVQPPTSLHLPTCRDIITSYIRHHISVIRSLLRRDDVQPPTSNLQHHHIRENHKNSRHQRSPTSNLQHPTSNIITSVKIIKIRIISVPQHPTSNLQPPTSPFIRLTPPFSQTLFSSYLI